MLSLISTDFAILAAEAAIDLDNMLSGVASRFEAIDQLGNLLKTVVGKKTSDKGRPHIDAATLSVLHATAIKMKDKSATAEQLLNYIEDVAESLVDKSCLEKSGPFKVRGCKFCLALSQTILAECKNRYNLRQECW